MTVTRHPEVVTALVDGQQVLLNPDMQFFKLDATGSVVWELLADPQTAESVARVLTQQFDVDLATAQDDVRRFLDALDRIGCLTRV